MENEVNGWIRIIRKEQMNEKFINKRKMGQMDKDHKKSMNERKMNK